MATEPKQFFFNGRTHSEAQMYEAFYKLRGKPFQLTPDPELLFPSISHKRAMAYLQYGVEQKEGFVVITGAVGTGKTLLIQTLTKVLNNPNIAMATIASANMDVDDVLPTVVSAFGLSSQTASQETLYQHLHRYLMSLRDQRGHALLVVDEAQLLTPAALEGLRILSNMEVNGSALMQVFLVGQSELRQMLSRDRMEQLRQRVIASCELLPLGEKESESYIIHRLRTVGWQHDPSFDSAIFPVIQRASEGIPRKINLIMSRLLLYGYLEERHKLDSGALRTVLKEMEEELPSMKSSLSSNEAPKKPELLQSESHPTRRHRMDLVSLEAKLTNLLKQVRENIKQQEEQ